MADFLYDLFTWAVAFAIGYGIVWTIEEIGGHRRRKREMMAELERLSNMLRDYDRERREGDSK